MSRTAADTSVVVAALLSWHEAHEESLDALSTALRGDFVLPQSSLLESFSVMTRLPGSHRLSPKDALEALAGSFGSLRLATLSGARTWPLLRGLVAHQLAGGATYDARILEEARSAGARNLLTLNPVDFERFGRQGVEILVPGSRGA